MSTASTMDRIPAARLAEQWFGFLHGLIGTIQQSYLRAQREGTINQKIIARRLGKDPATISRCLSGQQNMTIRTMHDLARAMDCRLQVELVPLSSLPIANRPRQSDTEQATPTISSSLSLVFPIKPSVGGNTMLAQ
jgi:plasmid maintenance system antidote protein VapI